LDNVSVSGFAGFWDLRDFVWGAWGWSIVLDNVSVSGFAGFWDLQDFVWGAWGWSIVLDNVSVSGFAGFWDLQDFVWGAWGWSIVFILENRNRISRCKLHPISAPNPVHPLILKS
jgi:hypothetical protein